MKKYWISTFGCQMNISDSERIASTMQSMGFRLAPDEKEADFIIVNMCSVRQSAVDRVYGQANNLRRLKRRHKALKTILTGCVLGVDKEKMSKIFDFILDKNDMQNWPAIISNKPLARKKDYLKIDPVYGSEIRAFVPISNGCDNFCTYCAVPYTRGKLVSRNHKDILKEVKDLVKREYKEIWLLGENVNSYVSPMNKNFDFAELIKEIDKIKGDFWLRFTTPHPKYFSGKLIEVLARSNKFAPYLNLPMQSGDDTILKKMNRPYTAKKYKELVNGLRFAFEKYREGTDKILGISTDMIVGFPTETKIQFDNSERAMQELEFDMAFLSEYSPRPQSFCYKNVPDDVAKKDKEIRKEKLNDILRKTALKKNQEFLGKTIPVLVYKKEKEYYIAETRQNKPIRFKSPENGLEGQFVNVRVNKVSPWSMEAEFVSVSNSRKAKLVVIVGPTASGKTDLAIRLAKKFNGEIVSADSRLVYKGMDIGTAKPQKDKEKKGGYYVKGIKHHLIDILAPNEEFNAALFKERAIGAINKIVEAGKTPFLVGGTGLYIKAITDNLDFPKIKPDLKLRKDLEKKSAEELFEIYKKLDTNGAEKIDKNNKRRLVRAIEVCKITGKPFWQERKKQEPIYDILQLGIKVSKKELDLRITSRVKKMIKAGLEKEVKKLSNKYGFKLAPMQTIGYSEWSSAVEGPASAKGSGEAKPAVASKFAKATPDKKAMAGEKIIKNTIGFAKRQAVWFKKEKDIKWIKDYKQAEAKIKKFLSK
jgi:tRNA-2-methylthio-N6-dimethylallyladenosine synthase